MEFLSVAPGIALAIRPLAREVSQLNQDFGLVPHVAPTLSCACLSSTASVLQLQVPQQLARQLHPAPCCVVFNGPTCTHVGVLVPGRSERVSRKQREQPPTPLHPDFAGARCFLHRLTQPILARREVIITTAPVENSARRFTAEFSKCGSNRGCQWSVALSWIQLLSRPSNALSVPKLAADQASWPTSSQGYVGGKHANRFLHLKPTLPLIER